MFFKYEDDIGYSTIHWQYFVWFNSCFRSAISFIFLFIVENIAWLFNSLNKIVFNSFIVKRGWQETPACCCEYNFVSEHSSDFFYKVLLLKILSFFRRNRIALRVVLSTPHFLVLWLRVRRTFIIDYCGCLYLFALIYLSCSPISNWFLNPPGFFHKEWKPVLLLPLLTMRLFRPVDKQQSDWKFIRRN